MSLQEQIRAPLLIFPQINSCSAILLLVLLDHFQVLLDTLSWGFRIEFRAMRVCSSPLCLRDRRLILPACLPIKGFAVEYSSGHGETVSSNTFCLGLNHIITDAHFRLGDNQL